MVQFDIAGYLGGLNNKQLMDIQEFGPNVPAGVDRGAVMQQARQMLSQGGAGGQATWTGQDRRLYDGIMNGTYTPAQAEQVFRTNATRLGLNQQNIPQQFQGAWQAANSGNGMGPNARVGSHTAQPPAASTQQFGASTPMAQGLPQTTAQPMAQSGLPQATAAPMASSGQPTAQGQPAAQGAKSQQPQIGLMGSEQALRQGLAAGTGALDLALAQGRGDLAQAGQGANSTLDAFYQPGQQSNDYQAALSGALGGAAQQQAMDRFMGSPGQQYLIDQSERAITRNAAATGGLGSGNVQRALQENAIGLAAQDFGNAFNRLGSVSDRGLTAGRQTSGNQMATGQALAGLTQNAGNMAAQMGYNTGNNLASGRTRAGEMIANNIQGTSSNLANTMLGTGGQMSNVIGQGGSNLAQLLAGAGQAMYGADSTLAQILANISQNAGANSAGLPGLGGTSQTQGALAGIGNFMTGLGQL